MKDHNPKNMQCVLCGVRAVKHLKNGPPLGGGRWLCAAHCADNDVRETPHALFRAQQQRFDFTLDACASHDNAKCDHYFTEGGLWVKDGGPGLVLSGVDGLTGSWKGERVWCNPPYSSIGDWVLKAWDSGAESVCMLVPATRTEQDWWQDGVEPFRDWHRFNQEDPEPLPNDWRDFSVEFLRGRQHFLEDGKPIMRKNKDGSLWLNPRTGKPQRSSPKFGCALLLWS